jgi:hypothetical protein
MRYRATKQKPGGEMRRFDNGDRAQFPTALEAMSGLIKVLPGEND